MYGIYEKNLKLKKGNPKAETALVPDYGLDQEVSKFFCKESDNKYYKLCGSDGLCCTTQLGHYSVKHLQTICK